MFAPVLKGPPALPVANPLEDAELDGEIRVRYPLGGALSPAYFGEVSRARSDSQMIMNGICQATISRGVRG
jgi:hypothetical protein